MQMIRAMSLGIAVLLAAELAAEDTAETAIVAATPETAVALWQDEPTRIFDASEVNLSDFQWIARPVVIFGDSPNDPNFRRQMELLAQRPDDLVDRDVVLITDTEADDLSDIRRQLRPRAFMLAILGKDGQVKLRKPLPWDVRELSRSIDKMPLRQQEINAARGF